MQSNVDLYPRWSHSADPRHPPNPYPRLRLPIPVAIIHRAHHPNKYYVFPLYAGVLIRYAEPETLERNRGIPRRDYAAGRPLFHDATDKDGLTIYHLHRAPRDVSWKV